MLQLNDIVWSGVDRNGDHYHIRYVDVKKENGCWCPDDKKAHDFLKKIGIPIGTHPFYSEGYQAYGCWWESGKREISPHLIALANENEKNINYTHRLRKDDVV